MIFSPLLYRLLSTLRDRGRYNEKLRKHERTNFALNRNESNPFVSLSSVTNL